ncbi:peptide/nickel transport system ATP-binding protein [Rhizobium petrolearium]|uniref:ABC transporter ATP-binding protein n=1 Tax=Neorhizobium petrolearium TaxID=515361 RepID=UPI001AE915E5|nr:ABC transporter ATP-binding protein [Neorhizobium petrolearium]MBP1847409.1 peptide/nickel transport system ATP-binding protein [Neorhizobium petrolearium]
MRGSITLEELTVSFNGVRVLHGIDLAIGPGETLGLVGESGSGKSVTWLAALGLLPPKAKVSGRVMLNDRNLLDMPDSKLTGIRGGRIAMIFQDPVSALNPMLTVKRQIGETLALHRGLSGAAIKAEAKRLLDLVGIPDAERRLNAYPHEFSGGQNQRVMIAMALAGQPDLLVADEPTTALDVTIQAQILDLLALTQRETGMALVLISHDLGVVSQVCDRVAVMYAGRIVEEAPVERLFEHPAHPYSQGLMGSLPAIDGPRRRLTAIGGTVPDASSLPAGCSFAPRCAFAETQCHEQIPLLAGIGRDHSVACLVSEAQPSAAIRYSRQKEQRIEA